MIAWQQQFQAGQKGRGRPKDTRQRFRPSSVLRRSGTDWQRAGVTGETVTAFVGRGLMVREGHLTLTDDGRAALRALLTRL